MKMEDYFKSREGIDYLIELSKRFNDSLENIINTVADVSFTRKNKSFDLNVKSFTGSIEEIAKKQNDFFGKNKIKILRILCKSREVSLFYCNA